MLAASATRTMAAFRSDADAAARAATTAAEEGKGGGRHPSQRDPWQVPRGSPRASTAGTRFFAPVLEEVERAAAAAVKAVQAAPASVRSAATATVVRNRHGRWWWPLPVLAPTCALLRYWTWVLALLLAWTATVTPFQARTRAHAHTHMHTHKPTFAHAPAHTHASAACLPFLLPARCVFWARRRWTRAASGSPQSACATFCSAWTCC
jgi:hypothetical protein